MEVKDFIISSLVNISNNIFGIYFKYAHDEVTNFHIIEVSPEEIRRGDNSYMNMEYGLWESFRNTFPNEDLLISAPNEINNMHNIIYESSSSSVVYSESDLSLNFSLIETNSHNCFENDYLLAA